MLIKNIMKTEKYKVMVNGHLGVHKIKTNSDVHAMSTIKNKIKNNYKRLGKQEPNIWIINKI